MKKLERTRITRETQSSRAREQGGLRSKNSWLVAGGPAEHTDANADELGELMV